jgi:hypothetical protein
MLMYFQIFQDLLIVPRLLVTRIFIICVPCDITVNDAELCSEVLNLMTLNSEEENCTSADISNPS